MVAHTGTSLRVKPWALLTASPGTVFAGCPRPVDASPTTVRAPLPGRGRCPRPPGRFCFCSWKWGRGPWSRRSVQRPRRIGSTAVGRGQPLDPPLPALPNPALCLEGTGRWGWVRVPGVPRFAGGYGLWDGRLEAVPVSGFLVGPHSTQPLPGPSASLSSPGPGPQSRFG